MRSQDVKYAIERFFSADVIGPYLAYFSDIVGAPSAPAKGVPASADRHAGCPHARVPAARRTAAAFIGALTMAASAPVPEEYARPFDAQEPSTYNTHVVATGPYMVRNDAPAGRSATRPGRGSSSCATRTGGEDRPSPGATSTAIRIRTNASDATIASRQVLAGPHVVWTARRHRPSSAT